MMISVLGFVFEIGPVTLFDYCLKVGIVMILCLRHITLCFSLISCEPVCKMNCCYHLPCLYGSSFSCFQPLVSPLHPFHIVLFNRQEEAQDCEST